jgi:hypothetical protein
MGRWSGVFLTNVILLPSYGARESLCASFKLVQIMDPFITMSESERIPGGGSCLLPDDAFDAYMPAVDLIAESAEPFVVARAEVARGGADKNLDFGQRCVAVVTPGRQVIFIPAPKPGRATSKEVLQARSVLPADKALNVTVVGFTSLELILRDARRCIPFLPQLLALAHAGHNVIVFEGHESAFEYSLRGAQALLVDSAMIPFLFRNWWETALRAIRDRKRILVCDRLNGAIRPVRPD